MKEKTFKVTGMHCASCELLIERKLLDLPGVKSVEASKNKNEVLLEYEGREPKAEELSRLFSQEKYNFFDQSIKTDAQKEEDSEKIDSHTLIVVSILLVVSFWFILKGLGIANLVNINANSSLLAFLALGVVAGLSSCAALVGGLVLSMSKQWLELYSKEDKFSKKIQPHLLFNFGRIASYTFFGGLLGLIGGKLQISLGFTSFLVMAVSLLMILMALQMLGVSYFQKFQIRMPKALTRFAADEKNFQGKYMPALMGAMTFFLPCGFTITAQGFALLSGDPIRGSLTMLFFVLGTTPMLLGIGLSTVKFSQNHQFADVFPKVAGVLVLLFALFNINNQLAVLGFSNLSDLGQKSSSLVKDDKSGMAPLIDGKQVLKMSASSSGYSPNSFKVKVGVPVRWEITDTGTSGCTNAVISKGLFDGQINLTPGQTSIKEFTPTKPGKYKFSCWMGMITGSIEVIDPSSVSNNSNNTNLVQAVPTEIPSGAKGCGCSGTVSGAN